MTAPPPSDPTRLPLRWQGTPDGRSLGKPIQVVRDFLADHPDGVSRDELQQAVQSRLGERYPTARGAFGKLLYELRKQDEVAEVGGKLVPRRLSRTTGGRHR
ncbi:MAG: hypothetical protein WBR13_06860 [Allosphingosinicella sp.]